MQKQFKLRNETGRTGIVHLITTLDAGGAEAMLYKFLKHTSNSSKNHYSVISLTGNGFYGSRIRKLGIPVYPLNMEGRLQDLKELFRLFRLLRRLRPKLLQTWLYHSDLIGLCLGRLAGIKKILWNVRCSNMNLKHYALTTQLVFYLLAKISRLPDAVVVNSEAGKRFHQANGYSPRRWVVIPNGFETDHFVPNPENRRKIREKLGIGTSIPVIGMVARFDPMKDHATFFAAAKHLHDDLPETKFMLVGKGIESSNQSITALVTKFSIENSVYLLGARTDIAEVMPSFDLSTLTSSFGEGFPNVLGEAMACGVPCIATDVGDAAMIIGNTGNVVPSGDPNALAEAWKNFLTKSPGKRKIIGLEARKRIEALFSIARIVREYEQLYCRILEWQVAGDGNHLL